MSTEIVRSILAQTKALQKDAINLVGTLLGPDAHAASWLREWQQPEQRGRTYGTDLLHVVSASDYFAGPNKVPKCVVPQIR